MPKGKAPNSSHAVTDWIQKQDPELRALVESVRQHILAASDEIGEQIKWNAPAFYFTGEMKPFDPKEYKRDIAVMNLRKGNVLLIFPTGSVITNSHGLLEGDYKDGRRMITFNSMDEFIKQGGVLQAVIRDWLDKVERT